jgi:hypothetical protein
LTDEDHVASRKDWNYGCSSSVFNNFTARRFPVIDLDFVDAEVEDSAVVEAFG